MPTVGTAVYANYKICVLQSTNRCMYTKVSVKIQQLCGFLVNSASSSQSMRTPSCFGLPKITRERNYSQKSHWMCAHNSKTPTVAGCTKLVTYGMLRRFSYGNSGWVPSSITHLWTGHQNKQRLSGACESPLMIRYTRPEIH